MESRVRAALEIEIGTLRKELASSRVKSASYERAREVVEPPEMEAIYNAMRITNATRTKCRCDSPNHLASI